MNQIFKSSGGFHIDLSKIIAIYDPVVERGNICFTVEVQLKDKPIYCCGYVLEEEANRATHKELLDAWIAYTQSQPPTELMHIQV